MLDDTNIPCGLFLFFPEMLMEESVGVRMKPRCFRSSFLRTRLPLKVRWMIHLMTFKREQGLSGFLDRVWVESHFPLIRPLVNKFKIMVEIWLRAKGL